MIAAIYNGAKKIDFAELPMPECDDNGIVIKNICASVCGSDVTAYHYGGAHVMVFEGNEFGHEMVGRVVKAGKNVVGIKEGDRVFPVPEFAKNDYMRAATIGGFSEYVELPQCTVNHSVYLVPDEIENDLASIIEPFTVGANAVWRMNVESGKKAIVFGAGAIGLTAAVTLKYLGCEVVVVDMLEERLDIAKSLGLHVCNVLTESYMEACTRILGGAYGFTGPAIDCDYYVDATAKSPAVMEMINNSPNMDPVGKQPVVQTFLGCAKGMAKLSVAGIPERPVEVNLTPLIYTGLQIIGPAGANDTVIRLVMEILASNKFPMRNIITHTFRQKDLVQAIEQASDTRNAMKVIIKYDA